MTGLHKSPGSSQRSQGTGKEVSLRLDNLGAGGVLLDGRDALLQGREGVCKMAKILLKRFADEAEWKSFCDFPCFDRITSINLTCVMIDYNQPN